MFFCRRNCGCNSCGGGNTVVGGNTGHGGGCGGHGNPCSPNPHNQEFSRVVAKWQTVRHFKVSSHDTIEPLCGDVGGRIDFENAMPDGGCGCNG